MPKNPRTVGHGRAPQSLHPYVRDSTLARLYRFHASRFLAPANEPMANGVAPFTPQWRDFSRGYRCEKVEESGPAIQAAVTSPRAAIVETMRRASLDRSQSRNSRALTVRFRLVVHAIQTAYDA